MSLTLRFVLAGLTALLSGTGILIWRPEILATYHYNQYVVAVTHCFVLGWICSVVMGAMYQLVPVALETKLYSERLARWHFALHAAGVAGMVWMFWIWDMKQVGLFGSLFAFGVVLFVYDLGRTLFTIPRWNVVAAAIASALVWLVLTVSAGLFLAASKCWPIHLFEPIAQMHAHAHLGVLGFFVMMLVGVSYKLIPMFTLSEVCKRRRAAWSIVLLNGGLAGAFSSIVLGSRWKPVFAGVTGIALALYGLELRAILQARKRQALDWGIKSFITAVALLLPVGVLGLVLSWPQLPLTPFTGQLENLYGLLTLLGVLTLAILGMLYKIVPFLVWYARYSREIGRSKVPALADLYSVRWQVWGYVLFVVGVLATSASTICACPAAVRCSCSVVGISLILFLVNMGRILSHIYRPRIEPLTLPCASTHPNPA